MIRWIACDCGHRWMDHMLYNAIHPCLRFPMQNLILSEKP